LLLAALLSVSLLAGCAAPVTGVNSVGDIEKDPDNTGDTGAKISVVATVFPYYDFVRAIAGDRADITMLIPPGVEVHSYEPTPADIIAIGNCDLFIYTGGGLEVWAGAILESVSNKDMRILSLADGTELKPEHVHEHADRDRRAGHDGEVGDKSDHKGHPDDEDHFHEYDPHIWTSPVNASIMADMILEALCIIDPDNRDHFTANADKLKAGLEELDEKFREIVANAKRREIYIADRFAMRYFADEYGLDYHAAFDSCSSETEPSAAVITEMADQIKKENIRFIYHGELTAPQIARTLSNETGAELLLLHSCHNVSKEEFEDGATYISLMEQNAENLEKGLN
jgi:zinc transport system substrate-binding protein